MTTVIEVRVCIRDVGRVNVGGYLGMGFVGAGGAIEGPVAGCDTRVIDDGDGAVEDVESEALHPTVPVALVELVASVWVSEEPRALAHLRAQGVVEVPSSTWAELLQLASGRELGHE